MKKEDWIQLEQVLKEIGFSRDLSQRKVSSIAWFVSAKAATEVTTYLRFVFKPKLRVLTAHLGWRHEASHNFCLEALESDWPSGFSWLSEVGILGGPCLSLFNLAEHMGWPLAGIPIDGLRSISAMQLRDAIVNDSWMSIDAKALLGRYVKDEKPFGWRSCNSAIRLAQIAGLCVSTKNSNEIFEQCAATHLTLIEADMFGLGSASGWIAALRNRLEGNQGVIGTEYNF